MPDFGDYRFAHLPHRANCALALLVGNQSSTYFNSLTSAVALINCLVAGVSLRNKNSLETLKGVNKIISLRLLHFAAGLF